MLHEVSLHDMSMPLETQQSGGLTRGYRVTLFRMVLSIWSSALRAVRWMSCESLPMAMLNTVRTCTRQQCSQNEKPVSPGKMTGHAVAGRAGD